MSDSNTALYEAAILARSGRLDEAEKRLAQAASAYPRLIRSHGQILAALGRWREAIDRFQIVVDDDPFDFDSWMSLGKLKAILKDTRGALAAFDRVLAARPGDAPALAGKSDLLLAMGQAALAEPLLRVLAETDEAYAKCRHYLSLATIGRSRDAQELYGHAPEAWISDAEKALALARDALGLRAMAEAERWYRHAIGLAPENAEALAGLGSVLASSGRRDQAFAYLRAQPETS